MTLTGDAKFEEKLTCGLENDMRNIANFHQSTWKSQNYDWWDLIQTRKIWAQNPQRSYMSWQWRMMQNLKRNWRVISKLTWGIWRVLTRALESLDNFHFNVLLLSKAYIVWAKKVQRSYVWLHWRLMQNLEEKWLVLSKMTWGTWQICIGWKK